MTEQTVSVIGENLRITGNLKTEGSLSIIGAIIGHTKCDDIIVSAIATIKGNILANSATIIGTVTGNINAEFVVLKDGSIVKGNITSNNFTVEEGAQIEGSLSINTKQVAQKPEVS
ncbi:MAG: polymer-forming cytoskeletal protein [Paracoccaceae bacterium]|jgi:cytoskeletal protein CcmA (bactofilin family)